MGCSKQNPDGGKRYRTENLLLQINYQQQHKRLNETNDIATKCNV